MTDTYDDSRAIATFCWNGGGGRSLDVEVELVQRWVVQFDRCEMTGCSRRIVGRLKRRRIEIIDDERNEVSAVLSPID